MLLIPLGLGFSSKCSRSNLKYCCIIVLIFTSRSRSKLFTSWSFGYLIFIPIAKFDDNKYLLPFIPIMIPFESKC